MLLNYYIYYNDVALFIAEDIGEDFIYRYYNEPYCAAMRFEYMPDKLLKVSEVMSQQEFMQFKAHCEILRNKNGCLKYKNNMYINQTLVPFTVTLYSFELENHIYYGGLAVKSVLSFEEIKLYTNNTIFNQLNVESTEALFTLKFTQSKNCLLSTHNKYLTDYLDIKNAILENELLIDLFPKKVATFLSEGFLKCIQDKDVYHSQIIYDCTRYDYSRYYCPSNGYFYLSVTFMPIETEMNYSCFCIAKDITNEILSERKNDELSLEYNTIFYTSPNAIAVLKVLKDNSIMLEKQNKRMEAFLNRFNYILLQLISSEQIIETIIQEKSHYDSMFSLKVKDKNYSVHTNLVPVIKNDQVVKIILTILGVTQSEEIKKVEVRLTRRENEIVSMAAQGEKNDYIASKLGISTGTVKKTLSNVYKKLNINSRVELIKHFMNSNP